MGNGIRRQIIVGLKAKLIKRGILDYDIQQNYISSWFAKYGKVRRKQLKAMWDEQKGLCIYCKEPTWVGTEDAVTPTGLTKKKRATIEHIICSADGGPDKMSNYIMSCHNCNNRRGRIPHEEFQTLVATGQIVNTELLKNLNRKIQLKDAA